jgi:hypothetical protein
MLDSPQSSSTTGGWIYFTDYGSRTLVEYKTRYLHLSQCFVDGTYYKINDTTHCKLLENRQVARGVPIGKSGGTGPGGTLDAFPHHLHFEAWKKINNVFRRIDPYKWQGSYADPYLYSNPVSTWEAWSF